MAEQISRQTAYLVGIDEIHPSQYTKSEGEWDPNFLTIRGLKVSRVNIIGVVISVSEDKNTFSVDDGTGNISVRIFDSNSLQVSLEIGDIILIIGRPREFNEEKYIVPEIVKHIQDEIWLEIRKKQLEKLRKEIPPQQERIVEPIKEAPKTEAVVEKEETVVEEETTTEADKVFSLIKKLDSGEGVEIEEIIKQHPEAEKIVNSLLQEGEIFEVKPGKVKVLE